MKLNSIATLLGCITGIAHISWVVYNSHPHIHNNANYGGIDDDIFHQRNNSDDQGGASSKQSVHENETINQDHEERIRRMKEAERRRKKKERQRQKEEEDLVRETVDSTESFSNYYDELKKAKEEEERKAHRDSSSSASSADEEPELDDDLRPDDWCHSEETEESNKEAEAEFFTRKKALNLEWEKQKSQHYQRSYYKVLGLNKESSPSDVKKAYRVASINNHPDRGGDPALQADINRAYEVLGDTRLRKSYNFFLIQNRIKY